MFLNIYEVLDMILMTLIIGYIFMSSFRPHRTGDDILDRYMKKGRRGFDWNALWFAASVTAPTIIMHELGHKITALSFGLQSTFHAACSTSNLAANGLGGFIDFYCGLNILAIILKTIGVGFLFFVPGYVQTVGATVGQHVLIALAGPLINLIFFATAWIILKRAKRLKPKTVQYLMLTKNINLFLFVFNILPIPGFDGYSVFAGLVQLF